MPFPKDHFTATLRARTPSVRLLSRTQRTSFPPASSYDRAGFGQSDKAPVQQQSVKEVVDDLQGLLKWSGERGPFTIVAHSLAGIYARSFVARYTGEVAALVFVDSSHEEQALRLHELDPNGPEPDETTARLGFFAKSGERLEWRTDLPLIVLGRGKPFPRTQQFSEEQFAAWDRIWREFQQDLAKRSPNGQFRVAEQSGHFISEDQPGLVIQAIRDVLQGL